ncbi:hypothetical protein [Actibacterium sp. D379-3]
MLGLIRLGVFGLIGLMILYLLVSVYSRSVRREKLENRADELIAGGDLDAAGRDAYIEDGMRAYETSLRRKLIAGVIVVPVVGVVILVYVMNFM